MGCEVQQTREADGVESSLQCRLVERIETAERFPAFDVLRVVGALLVIFSHSFAVVGRAEPLPFHLAAFPVTWGGVGVGLFFVASGFLLVASWHRDNNLQRFALRRVARIWPGYMAAVLVTAIVIGGIATDWSRLDYFTSGATWSYVAHNAVMSPIVLRIPGLFGNLPFPEANGALWTLAYEVVAYICLAAVGAVGLLRRRWFMPAVFAALVLLAGLGLGRSIVPLPGRAINGIEAYRLVFLGSFFAGGAAWATAHLSRGRWMAGTGVAMLAGAVALDEALLFLPGLVLVVIFAGTSSGPAASLLDGRTDISYGLYLYGWPVQQLLVWTGVAPSAWWLNFVLAVAATAPLAYLSARLVERPAQQRLRQRLGSRALTS